MKLEQIKKQILSEHQSLRGLLEAVAQRAEKVAGDDVSCVPALREGAHQLSDALLRHMESEEKHLAALSRGGGPHWARHLEEFKHHHFHQRQLLGHFIERVDSVQLPHRLGEIVQAMTNAVQLDIEHEETALFAPEAICSVQGA
jgi:iron-sulfur cluster repair protein YtfE (RIC family)